MRLSVGKDQSVEGSVRGENVRKLGPEIWNARQYRANQLLIKKKVDNPYISHMCVYVYIFIFVLDN